MKTRAALSIVVSLLALLPSLSGQNNNHTRSNAYQYVETTIGAPAYRAEQVYGAKPVNRTRRQTTASETAASADSVYETSTGYVIYVNETGADSDSHAIRTSSSGYSSENGGVPSNLPTDRNDVNIPRPFRECRNDEFRCGSNECVPASARCDNKIDCRDSSDEESCITNGCTLPQQPEGGRYTVGGCGEPCYKNPGDIVPKNTILTYNCTEKYFLKGNTVSICLNEDWIAPPSCLRICSALRSTSVDISCSYQGETVSCTERVLPGTQARLSCKSSHTLHITNDPGYRNIVCINDGYWNRPLFRCLPECGISTPQGSPTIVNGSEAKVGTFPWHVGIYRKNNDTEYEQICGGSLINNNLVISVAAIIFFSECNKWEFFKVLQFMQSSSKCTETQSNIEPYEENENDNSVKPPSKDIPEKRNKTPKIQNSIEDEILKKALEEIMSQKKIPDDDAQVFGNFVASAIRNLRSEEYRRKLKRKIQEIILEMEELDDLSATPMTNKEKDSVVGTSPIFGTLTRMLSDTKVYEDLKNTNK